MMKKLKALMTALVIVNIFLSVSAFFELFRNFNSNNGGQTLLMGLILSMFIAIHLAYIIVSFENFLERLIYLFKKELEE